MSPNWHTAYTLSLDIKTSEKSAVKDLIITKYTINNNPTEYSYNDKIISNYKLNDNKNTTYHFQIKRNDDETVTMTNDEDTLAASNNGKAIIEININNFYIDINNILIFLVP